MEKIDDPDQQGTETSSVLPKTINDLLLSWVPFGIHRKSATLAVWNYNSMMRLTLN